MDQFADIDGEAEERFACAGDEDPESLEEDD